MQAVGNPIDRAKLGAEMRRKRIDKGWSQRKLAIAVGVSSTHIGNMETGTTGDPEMYARTFAILDDLEPATPVDQLRAEVLELRAVVEALLAREQERAAHLAEVERTARRSAGPDRGRRKPESSDSPPHPEAN